MSFPCRAEGAGILPPRYQHVWQRGPIPGTAAPNLGRFFQEKVLGLEQLTPVPLPEEAALTTTSFCRFTRISARSRDGGNVFHPSPCWGFSEQTLHTRGRVSSRNELRGPALPSPRGSAPDLCPRPGHLLFAAVLQSCTRCSCGAQSPSKGRISPGTEGKPWGKALGSSPEPRHAWGAPGRGMGRRSREGEKRTDKKHR